MPEEKIEHIEEKILPIDEPCTEEIIMVGNTKVYEPEKSPVDIPKAINYAVEEWSEIKGIGPTLANRLFEQGPYFDIEEVRNVKGIKPKLFESIKEWHMGKN